MDEVNFESKLNDLAKEIESVPAPQRDQLLSLIQQAGKHHKQLKQSVDSLQESLDYLRVSVKYLVFDLEATRRENVYLKKLLKDNNPK